MKGLTVCVEYDDLLAITLPRAARHFEQILVVSSPDDLATAHLVARIPEATLFQTDAFYRYGASFNKGLAVEEGFEVLGREGWICVFDADVLMPAEMDLRGIKPGYLYSPRRRICAHLTEWNAEIDWTVYPQFGDCEHAGYFQLFHAEDPVLQTRPWYGTHWVHAGGCDSDFQAKWPSAQRIWLPFHVLHIGPVAENWMGRCTSRIDGRPPDQAGQRREAMRRMHEARKLHGFDKEKLDLC